MIILSPPPPAVPPSPTGPLVQNGAPPSTTANCVLIVGSKQPSGLRALSVSPQAAVTELDFAFIASDGSNVITAWGRKWVLVVVPRGRALVFEVAHTGRFTFIASFDCPPNVCVASVMLAADEDDGAWALLGTDEGPDSHVHLLQLHGQESFSVLPVARWSVPGSVSSIVTLPQQGLRFAVASSSRGGVFLLDHADADSPRRLWPSREAQRASKVHVAQSFVPERHSGASFAAGTGDVLAVVTTLGWVSFYTGLASGKPVLQWEVDLDMDVIGLQLQTQPRDCATVDCVVCSWTGQVVVVGQSGETLAFERKAPTRVQSFECATNMIGDCLVLLQKETSGRVLAFNLSSIALLGSGYCLGEGMVCASVTPPSKVDDIEALMALDQAWAVAAGKLFGDLDG